MGLRRRTPWTIENRILQMESVQGEVINNVLSKISVGIPSAKIIELTFDKIIAGTNTASLTIGSGGSISSTNYSAGTAGFIINGDGSAEFNSVTVRGTVYANSGELGTLSVTGTLTLSGSGKIVSAASGDRFEWSAANPGKILFYDSAATTPGELSVGLGVDAFKLIGPTSSAQAVGLIIDQGVYDMRNWSRHFYLNSLGGLSSYLWLTSDSSGGGLIGSGSDPFNSSSPTYKLYFPGGLNPEFKFEGARVVLPSRSALFGESSTTGGINYLSFLLSNGNRAAYVGFGGSNEHFGLYNERPLGNVSIYAHNGTSIVSRLIIDADGAILLYGSTGDEVARLQSGYVRLAVGAALQFNGTTVPRLELGANNSVQVTNGFGWLQIGPQNTSYCHIYTDRPNFYFNKGLLVNGSTVWHSGNDGAGSGLNADLLDGVQGASYLRSDVTDTFSGTVLYSSSILPLSDANYNLGSSTRRWNVVYRVSESSSSDRRSKKHISDQVPGLALLTALRPRRFKYKGHTDEWWWGFVAQEVADVVDVDTHEIVHTDPEGMMGLNYEQLIAPLVKAVQELKAEVDELRGQLERRAA